MIKIQVHQTAVRNNVLIHYNDLQHKKAEAFLLGRGGEELQRFSLHNGINQLQLDDLEAGLYSLRIENGKDVTVKQIEISL
ncbi:MAG TPA: hypothetical protein VMR70_06765 [Flavisolibacter sp.]|nr:hypothetical protein [Flavisolibacter sp.]